MLLGLVALLGVAAGAGPDFKGSGGNAIYKRVHLTACDESLWCDEGHSGAGGCLVQPGETDAHTPPSPECPGPPRWSHSRTPGHGIEHISLPVLSTAPRKYGHPGPWMKRLDPTERARLTFDNNRRFGGWPFFCRASTDIVGCECDSTPPEPRS